MRSFNHSEGKLFPIFGKEAITASNKFPTNEDHWDCLIVVFRGFSISYFGSFRGVAVNPFVLYIFVIKVLFDLDAIRAPFSSNDSVTHPSQLRLSTIRMTSENKIYRILITYFAL
jgi:hypothetical protein